MIDVVRTYVRLSFGRFVVRAGLTVLASLSNLTQGWSAIETQAIHIDSLCLYCAWCYPPDDNSLSSSTLQSHFWRNFELIGFHLQRRYSFSVVFGLFRGSACANRYVSAGRGCCELIMSSCMLCVLLFS